MKVFVNAVSIREGGPRVVLLKLLPELVARSDVEFYIAAPPDACAELRQTVAKVIPVELGNSPISVLDWYERRLPSVIRAYAANVMFSLTNYLPLRPIGTPTLLLVQHAGHFSSVFDTLMRGPDVPWSQRVAWVVKRDWVRRSAERARVLTVQTQVLADAIAARTRLGRERIRVVPHGPGWVEHRQEPLSSLRRRSGPLRIGYVSKFGVQKNFDVLFRAVKSLADDGLNIRLVMTLDPKDAAASAVLAQAHALGLSDILENHGEVAPENLTALYDGLDIFVFPSLCESFGMPMLEAMARGLCVVVADTPETREMTGSTGLTFPSHDWRALATILRRLNDNEAERLARGRDSLNRAKEFSWAKAAEGTLDALRAAVAAHAA